MAVNHLGHFALTGRLLPLLLRAGDQGRDARVVVTSSGADRLGRLDLDDLAGARSYGRWRAYGASKLADLLFVRELDRRLRERDQPLLAVAAHPGWAATHLQSGQGNRLLKGALRLGNLLVAQSERAGAWPLLYAATMPDVQGGEYFGPDGPGELRGHPTRVGRSAAARDHALARGLWERSEQLTGVRYDASPDPRRPPACPPCPPAATPTRRSLRRPARTSECLVPLVRSPRRRPAGPYVALSAQARRSKGWQAALPPSRRTTVSISADDPHPRSRMAVLGTELAYVDTGDAERGTAVFLHGNPTSSYLWRNVIPHVRDAGFRCLAPDLAGFGDSGPSGTGGYRFADHAQHLDAWFDTLELDRVVLVLHDWGSGLGFWWARRHAERVRGIAYMEAILSELHWDDWPDAARGIFAAMRHRRARSSCSRRTSSSSGSCRPACCAG